MPVVSSQRGEPVIDVVISARDEAKTVAAVVATCLATGTVREVIVVDDGSVDDTAGLAAAAGAKVVATNPDRESPPAVCAERPARQALVGMARRALLMGAGRGRPGAPAERRPGAPRRPGSKAAAMATGVEVSDADAFLFLDADLLGLTPAHLEGLCRPFLDGVAEMSVGWLDYGPWNAVVVRLPPSTGERVVPRWVFDAVPQGRRAGYKMEILMNEVIAEGHARTAARTLEGVTHRTKRDKLGPREGRRQTWQMFWTLAGMPMTGEVRWRTFWFYWKGLTVLAPAGLAPAGRAPAGRAPAVLAPAVLAPDPARRPAASPDGSKGPGRH